MKPSTLFVGASFQKAGLLDGTKPFYDALMKVSFQASGRLFILFGFVQLVTLACHAGREAEIIQQWNNAFLSATRQDSLAPGIASRKMAIAHVAMFDAVNSLNPQYTSYIETQAPSIDLDSEQVAIGAAFRVGELEYPSHAGVFRNLMQRQVNQSGKAHQPSLEYGIQVANQLITMRASDGSTHSITYYPMNEIGLWKRTPPKLRPPESPHWPLVQPFCLDETFSTTPYTPPSLSSEAYTMAWKQIRDYGSKNSSLRTADQTETAFFWACFSYTATPPGHWNEIACNLLVERNIPLLGSLRLMALLNLAMADAGIYAWRVKYENHFWRPIHAVREADWDGNPYTVSDPGWESLLEAPPHPEYVSGHSTYTGTGGEVIRRFFETDHISFTATSDSLPGVIRSYETISDCEMEIGMSRIYGGIHFGFSNLDGLELGREIGKEVFENYLLPMAME